MQTLPSDVKPSASVVRLAQPADEDALITLGKELHQDNGIFPISEEKIEAVIRRAIYPQVQEPNDLPVIIGVVGAPGHIEASIGMMITQHWYTDAWHVEELFNFVRPKFRRSRHANALIAFAKDVQIKLEIPLLIGILSCKDTKEKIKLYSRRLGEPAGAYFVLPNWTELNEQQKSAEHAA